MFRRGNHPEHNRMKPRRIKSSLVLISLVLLLTLGIGGTLAFVLDYTDALVNIFKPSAVEITINEDFTDGDTVKSNVTIQNTGNIPVWVRAGVIINWVDKDGKIVNSVPGGYSYSLGSSGAIPHDSGWVTVGSVYYWNAELPVNGSTGNLIDSIEMITPSEPEYFLNVQILADAVQTAPAKAVQDAWGVDMPVTGGVG